MTNEEKSLLLQDLFGRLPYGTKIECGTDYDFKNDITDTCKLLSVNIDNELCEIKTLDKNRYVFNESLDTIKPYLRPMLSMTEEEFKEYSKLWDLQDEYATDADIRFKVDLFDWLDKKMFDYRGLIPMGLALPAPENMYH